MSTWRTNGFKKEAEEIAMKITLMNQDPK